ncbi:prolyl oligopeptidase family serine peptidase [Nostoc sp. CHAB 5836]|nr:prolyl oligopeptidase family serine peptidase [Nostoc sp. CHAB 5836]
MIRLDGPKVGFDGDDPAYLVVLLHSYGNNGDDMISLAQIFANILPSTIFHCPTAPARCDDYPDYHQWFRISGDDQNAITADLRSTSRTLDEFLDNMMNRYGLDEAHTVLVGFSQGAAMALHAGLRRAKPLAGIISFSGALEMPDALAAEIKSRPEVLLIHGDSDQVIPVEQALRAAYFLRASGVEVDLHIAKDVDHQVAPTGVSIAWRFLYKVTGLPVPP